MTNHLVLRNMLTDQRDELKPSFSNLSDKAFTTEVVRRYEAEIGRSILNKVRLQLQRKAKTYFETLENDLKKIRPCSNVNQSFVKRMRQQLIGKFLYKSFLQQKPVRNMDDWAHILEFIFLSAERSAPKKPGAPRAWWLIPLVLKKSLKKEFYDSVHVVDYCFYLRYGSKSKTHFENFCQENVLKHKRLMKVLRDGKTDDLDSFLRSYRRHKKDLEI